MALINLKYILSNIIGQSHHVHWEVMVNYYGNNLQLISLTLNIYLNLFYLSGTDYLNLSGSNHLYLAQTKDLAQTHSPLLYWAVHVRREPSSANP